MRKSKVPNNTWKCQLHHNLICQPSVDGAGNTGKRGCVNSEYRQMESYRHQLTLVLTINETLALCHLSAVHQRLAKMFRGVLAWAYLPMFECMKVNRNSS